MNNVLRTYLDTKDYQSVTQSCIQWIREWFDKNGSLSPAVIGISGGKDSSVVAALCKAALGADRVRGVLMPAGIQPDIASSRLLVSHLSIPYYEVNVGSAIETLKASLPTELKDTSGRMKTNLPPRIRMATLYAVAQCINGRVSNNSNRSERYVGYSTLFGDSAGDFSPLANLTVTEVKLIGRCLGLPEELIEKAPSDGLTSKTDEDNFGFTYEALDTFILTGSCENAQTKELIIKRHTANLFKQQPMPAFSF